MARHVYNLWEGRVWRPTGRPAGAPALNSIRFSSDFGREVSSIIWSWRLKLHAPLPAAATTSAPACLIFVIMSVVTASGVAADMLYPSEMENTLAFSCGDRRQKEYALEMD